MEKRGIGETPAGFLPPGAQGYVALESYEGQAPRRSSPIRLNRYEDQMFPENQRQRIRRSSSCKRFPVCQNDSVPDKSCEKSEERRRSPSPRLPPPIGVPPRDAIGGDSSFDLMDSPFSSPMKMFAEEEHKTSTPKSSSSNPTILSRCSPVVGTPPGLMEIVVPPPGLMDLVVAPPTRLTPKNLEDIDRISSQVATSLQERQRSRPPSVGTSNPTTDSSRYSSGRLPNPATFLLVNLTLIVLFLSSIFCIQH